MTRNQRIFDARRAGKTFQSIADEFGLSRARIPQIVSEEEWLEARRLRRTEYIGRVLSEIRKAVAA